MFIYITCDLPINGVISLGQIWGISDHVGPLCVWVLQDILCWWSLRHASERYWWDIYSSLCCVLILFVAILSFVEFKSIVVSTVGFDMTSCVLWIDMAWSEMAWSDAAWCDVAWCDVIWSGAAWCDVIWCNPLFASGQNWFRSPGFIHTIVLTSLDTNTVFYYQFGDDSNGWSQVYQFTSRYSEYDEVWCDVISCGVTWCDVMWCGMAWCGVKWRNMTCQNLLKLISCSLIFILIFAVSAFTLTLKLTQSIIGCALNQFFGIRWSWYVIWCDIICMMWCDMIWYEKMSHDALMRTYSHS